MKTVLYLLFICIVTWLVGCEKAVTASNYAFSGESKQAGIYSKGHYVIEYDLAVADGTKTIFPSDNNARGYDYRFRLVANALP